ncbi:MAG: ATP-binding protein [Caulobacterales bacterium]
MLAAFLSPRADDLFSSVAAFADARELETLDVETGQQKARRSINVAIDSALRQRRNFGSRLALIKGDAGSGKSHVLTTTFKRAASMPTGEVYPAILQLTAPVDQSEYETWLMDATVRELSARHFGDDNNHSPLRRLAGQLLGRMQVSEQDEYLRLIDDLEDDGEIPLALRFSGRIRQEALGLLSEEPPKEAFLAVVLLAGFGDSSALTYLRQGVIDQRIQALGLDNVATPHQKIEVLRQLGLAAQIVGASLALGFDQVENAVRLGSEGLFVHALTQAVRLAESIHNAAIVVVVLGTEYEDIVGGNRQSVSLPLSDRDRIEGDPPFPAALERGTPEFLRKVISRRLAVLRERSKLATEPDALTPLPAWFLPRIDQARSVRYALREVAMLREHAIELQRLPSQGEYEGAVPPVEPPLDEQALDFDKEWADFLDLAPATRNRLLDQTKADLLAWWAHAGSHEFLSAQPIEVTRTALDDVHQTQVINLVFKSGDIPIEKRQLAICEAKNSRNDGLAAQVERFLSFSTGTPAILRTNGFAKSRTSLVAPALRRLEALSGLALDLSETEWHILQRAKDFADRVGSVGGFLTWRRDKQWLLQLMSPLLPLISTPEPLATEPSMQPPDPPMGPPLPSKGDEDPADSTTAPDSNFPVLIGSAFDGADVFWAPYREPPKQLNNFGVMVTGDAGSGKTQTIRVLIDAACREGLAVTLFDFKADYCDAGFAEPLGIEVVDVRASGLPFNPLQPPPRGSSGVQPIEHAYELAGVLARVFRLGAVQQGFLRDAIAAVYESSGILLRDWVDPASVSWPAFDLVLDRLRDIRGTAALVTKLAQLTDLGLFPSGAQAERSFETFVNKKVCLKLSELPTDEVKSALAEIIIIQLHGYALCGEKPRRLKRLMVFDEAHRVKDSQRLESLAREGRAFGVGIVIGTQFPGDIPETMAGNLATQLFLMNNQASHRRFVVTQLLGTVGGPDSRAMLEALGRLKPLEGVFANAHYNGGVFVRILPHWQRLERGRCELT